MRMEVKAAIDVRDQFRRCGFEIVDSGNPDQFEVRKNKCNYVLQRDAQANWMPAGPPYFLIRGLKCELEDRGYQKFWLRDGKRFPIRLQDLRALHEFDQEVRSILGLKSLYNESLGTTCARSVYDRLEGRPDE